MSVIAGMRKAARAAALAVPLAAAVMAMAAGPAAAAGQALAAGSEHGWQAAALASAGQRLPAGLTRAIQASPGTTARVRSASTLAWGQTAELIPADGATDNQFGNSVAVSSDGSTAVVGAWDHGNSVGAAYVFKNVSGTWTQTAELTASDGQNLDHFGYSVAISANGSTVVVGAPYAPGFQQDGAAYVYSDSSGSWTQTAKLAPAVSSRVSLGWSVAISGSGTTIAAGAIGWKSTGAVFMYHLTTGAWKQTHLFHASPLTSAGAQFGWSVGLSAGASTLVAGTGNANSAYVFTHTSTGWVQTTRLTASDGASGDSFGYAAAISGPGSTIVVSDPIGTDAAYVFSDSTGTWTQTAELTAPPPGAPALGWSVAISASGSTIVSGAPISDGTPSGAAYVFTDSSGTWKPTATLVPSDGQRTDNFGTSVGVSGKGGIAFAGADLHNGPGLNQEGAAYVFVK